MRILVAFIMAAVMLSGCSPTLERFEFTRLCMGVRTEVVLYAADRDHAERAATAAFARINEIDAEMSDYRKESAVSRINAAAGGEAVRVSGDLIEVLTTAARVSEASGGAFDVTVGPVVKLWRRSRDTGELPSDSEREAAQELVNWKMVEVDRGARTVRLLRAGMAIDLGGIAKGFAAEKAVERLRVLGYPWSLVAVSGDVFAGAAPPGEEGWRVAVGDQVMLVSEYAVSTSGDSQQVIEIEGTKYSHIVDAKPRTGGGVRGMVTVVAARGSEADALATAAYLTVGSGVSGLLKGFPGSGAICEEPDIDGQVLELFGDLHAVRLLAK